MTPKMLLLVSAGIAVPAFVALVVVNDTRRLRHNPRSGLITRSPLGNWLRSMDGVERTDYGIALAAATAMMALIFYGLPTLESYLSFILFHVILVTAIAFALDHRSAYKGKRRQGIPLGE